MVKPGTPSKMQFPSQRKALFPNRWQVSQQPLACARPTSGLETKLSAVKETAFSRASRVSPFRETEIREDAVRETAEDGHAT